MQERNISPKYEWPQVEASVTYAEEWPVIDDIDLSGPEKIQKVFNACCNNVAYAKTCVDLNLYLGMQRDSKELRGSIRSFVKAVTKSKDDESAEKSWERLLRHDAPRALGNAFTACLGAIVLDGAQGVQEYSYLDARKVVVHHINSCKNMPVMEKLPEKKENQSDCSCEMFIEL